MGKATRKFVKRCAKLINDSISDKTEIFKLRKELATLKKLYVEAVNGRTNESITNESAIKAQSAKIVLQRNEICKLEARVRILQSTHCVVPRSPYNLHQLCSENAHLQKRHREDMEAYQKMVDHYKGEMDKLTEIIIDQFRAQTMASTKREPEPEELEDFKKKYCL